jgi:hypothetical protein
MCQKSGGWYICGLLLVSFRGTNLTKMTLRMNYYSWQGVIVQHHIATLLYLVVPYLYPQDSWLMGACLIVEVNTWLLIARRVFNKQGFTPWVSDWSLFHTLSCREKYNWQVQYLIL